MFIKLLTSTVLINLLDPKPDPNLNQEQKFRIRFRLKKLGSTRVRIRIRTGPQHWLREREEGDEGDFIDENYYLHWWCELTTRALIQVIYVRLNPLIPISEEFRYRHQLPFRYVTKSISDIPISKIDKSFHL